MGLRDILNGPSTIKVVGFLRGIIVVLLRLNQIGVAKIRYI